MPVCAGTLGAWLLPPSLCLGQLALLVAWPGCGPLGCHPGPQRCWGEMYRAGSMGKALLGQCGSITPWSRVGTLPGASLPGKTLPGSVPSSPGVAPGFPQPVPIPGAKEWWGHPGDALGTALGAGTRSSTRPVSNAQLPCHLPARGDPSPVTEGLLAMGNAPCGHFPSIPSPMSSSGLCSSPQYVSRGRGARISVGLTKQCARVQKLGVPAGSAGSAPASGLHRALAN